MPLPCGHDSVLARIRLERLQVGRDGVMTGAGSEELREVASELFVGPRTIDYHLREVFRKLEIISCGELMRLALDADPTD